MQNTSPYRVIYGDTDQMGVVYYANYLRLFERGRCEFMRMLGVPYSEVEAQGHFLPVAEANVRYKRPARYDDLLHIETTLQDLGRARVKFSYRVTRGDGDDTTVCAIGETVHACVDKAGKPRRIPEELRALLSPPDIS